MLASASGDGTEGRDWYARAEAPVGRRSWHLATTAALAGTLGALRSQRPRAAVVAGATWLGLTADFAWRRIAPGPRDRAEVTRMLATSALIPPAAVSHWLRGQWRHRSAGVQLSLAPRPFQVWANEELAKKSRTARTGKSRLIDMSSPSTACNKHGHQSSENE